ncbi:MAG: hypothetical protein KGM43_07410 [Planctomycetota bacterium]|nr:hypothetical protein [Planctomycetota bacterium]
MGFMNGRLAYMRYRVSGEAPLPFGPEHLERVESNALGRRGPAETTDGVSFGWIAGEHVLDFDFDLAKNVVNDALHLAIRVDVDKISASLLRAYTRIELDARARLNPSGRPTKAQRVEAKEAAVQRAEVEAADGRYRKQALYPVLWDGRSNVLYAGATSSSVLERLMVLHRETFGRELEPITAGTLASASAATSGRASIWERYAPSIFHDDNNFDLETPSRGGSEIVWAESSPDARDVLGNEFLLWLWHATLHNGGVVSLADGSDVSVMLAKTLQLECPRGVSGRDTLSNDGPARLPEALRALQAGKLPRKAGMIIARQGAQYDLTLQAESLAVAGASLPRDEERLEESAARAGRVDALRHLAETLDLLFDAFVSRRVGDQWPGDLGEIRAWLKAA